MSLKFYCLSQNDTTAFRPFLGLILDSESMKGAEGSGFACGNAAFAARSGFLFETKSDPEVCTRLEHVSPKLLFSRDILPLTLSALKMVLLPRQKLPYRRLVPQKNVLVLGCADLAGLRLSRIYSALRGKWCGAMDS